MNSDPFTLRDAIIGIRRRLRLVTVMFLFILIAVGLVTLFSPKFYTSQAKLFVRLGRENVGLDPTATLGEGAIITTPMSREAEISSVVHMIRSRDLFEDDSGGANSLLAIVRSPVGQEHASCVTRNQISPFEI